MKAASSPSCSCAVRTRAPAGGCSALACSHAASGSPPFRGPATRRNSSCTRCSSRIAMASSASASRLIPLVEAQLFFELGAPQPEGALAAGQQILLEVLDVLADRG